MKFKDFTQEAYDDIQSYMGGEEQWEEINKTYGVVETKGIFQYDYESQLRNAATEYQRQNEEASNSVRRMFDNVNGVDDLYAARFRDEYMDLERFSTAIKELAALINVRSVENIYTMDCQTLKTKAGNIQAKVDSKITEYYKERFYSVDSNGKTVMNWDEINYEMRKEFVPDAELQALVSVFPKLSTDDEEETIANIENMLRAGYGNAKDDEWIDNADLEDPKYYSVSVTNTFKRAVDIYKTSMDIFEEVDINRTNTYIKCYDFVTVSDGYNYSGERKLVINFHDDKKYTWKETFLADLFMSRDAVYRGAVEKKYKVLPAWGVTDYSDISNVTVDDQKIDEVHELDVDGKTYYLWIINDLKTRNKASEVRIESVDKTTQNR